MGHDGSSYTEFDHVSCVELRPTSRKGTTSLRSIHPSTTLIVSTASSRTLLGALLLLTFQSTLVVGLLSVGLSATELGAAISACYPQVLDMAHLLRGCFIWNGIAPRLNNGIVQSLVASMSIVVLLATVVGLDYDIVRLDRNVARAADFFMKSRGDMVQE